MAWSKNATYVSRKANGTLTQFECVKVGAAAGDIDAIAASTDTVLGVLVDDPADNEYGLVQTSGVAKCKAGAAITEGEEVMAAADGDVITWVAAAGNYIVGVALTAATADQDIIEVDLRLGQGIS